ncbi:MAG TPA: outer membrane lipoprotein carrier protein LolA [Tepidisphaeraceae bacterium]|nr:outer membrane lipoprotein carrier protein LolA [Tepidisphaeraceae bacterium]
MTVRAAICLLLLAGVALGQTSRPSGDLNARMVAADAQAAKITDLTAHFVQEKQTAMLKEPLVSSGTVRVAGSVVRWDTQKPSPCVLYAGEGELRFYYPQQDLEEIYPIEKRYADLLASPLPRLKTIREHFDIAPLAETRPADDTLRLKLTPRDASLQADVQEVDVWLDTHNGVATTVVTTDPDGDVTTIHFTDLRINTGITPADLQLTVPPGTRISHPLSGVDSGAQP